MENKHKPLIEALVNTAALTLTSFGVLNITSGEYFGFLVIIFAVGLEFFKYYGRQKELW
jgi:hypothetical protein